MANEIGLEIDFFNPYVIPREFNFLSNKLSDDTYKYKCNKENPLE